jgi:vanadium-dependent haloperoxidase-like protein
MKQRTIAALAIVAVLLAGSSGLAGAAPTLEADQPGPVTDAVTMWNETAGATALAVGLAPTNNPLHESHLYAMMHVAIHDALNAIDRRFQPYVYTARGPSGASPDAAVAAAAHDVLVPVVNQLTPPFDAGIAAGVAVVEQAYKDALAAIPNGPAKNKGLKVGQAAAAAIVAARLTDGSDTLLVDTAYPQGTAPGEWRFTPPNDFAFAPGWADVTPFVLRDASQFRADPPYTVTDRQYTKDFNEIKALGGDDITTPSDRSKRQTEIALFWVESSPLQWNRIARTVSAEVGLDLWQNARLFGLLNIAMADGYVGSFETKYLYNFWRPITAIRMAATDGNPNTKADPTWTPLVPTPPIPDYDSAHSVEGGAAAQVFKRFFGTDRIDFETCSLTLPAGSTCDDASSVLRSYSSFTQAANENGESRILVGFHFRHAVDDGIAHGRKIGDRVVDRVMRRRR